MKNIFLKLMCRLLAAYARKVISIHKPFIIGITGSVGKSSTKEAIYQVLFDQYGSSVRKNFGNLNAEIGIPLTILGYEKVPNKWSWPIFLFSAYFRTLEKKYPKYLVLEMGVEHKGDLEYFGTIIKPDIVVITSVSGAHLTNFADLSEYHSEKLSILKVMKSDGKVIINVDDKVLAKENIKNSISYGIENKAADYRAEDILVSLEGTDYRICSVGQKIAIKSKILGKQMVYTQLAAFIIGHEMGFQSLLIKKSIEKILPMIGRVNVLQGKNESWIIDDTYNSNPSSLRAALDLLSTIKYVGRRVAIIGNMNELGSYEKEAHISVAKYARGKCDFAIFVGKNASIMSKGFDDPANSEAFTDRKILIANLKNLIKSKDLILIKASQNGNYFEEVTKELMQTPAKAKELLVRQSSSWLKKK